MHRKTSIAFMALAMAFHAWVAGPSRASDGATGYEAPRAPADGGPRRWQVAESGQIHVRAAPALDAAAVDALAGHDVVKNLGCLAAGGGTWCKVQPFRGGMRGYVEADSLRPARGPDGTVPMGADNSALRAARADFDARGRVPCAQERGQAMGECAVGVARGGGGDATAVVSFANGFRRMLYFVHGEFVRGNTTMSGNGTDTGWRKAGPTHIIRIDDQRYELDDELLFGD